MKRNILIICDAFPPAFAPRMGYLCKYINKSEWNPTVVSEQQESNTFKFLTGNCDTAYLNFYPAKNKILNKLIWIYTMIMDLLFNYKDKKFEKFISKITDKQQFDIVLCSTYRTFPLVAASKTAQKLNVPLIVDLRDIIEQYAGNEYISFGKISSIPFIGNFIISLFRKKFLENRNKVLKTASYVTTVSPWHVETLKKYNKNTTLIYNGFDPELFYPLHTINDKFRITYTGRIISLDMRNPTMLFEAIKKTNLTPDELKVEWYVDEESMIILQNHASKYDVSEYMEFKKYVQATEIPQILNSSGIILILTEYKKASSPKGIMTTKLFEAMAVEKPILCIPSDESFLKEKIEQTKTGLAARNVDEVTSFILKYYNQWKEKGSTSITPNHNEIEKFSRKGQARQFSEIFKKAINQN